MATTDTNRRLAAILCADVAGYSRLMGDDEEATVATLNAYREVFLGEIETFHGRVVDAKGDAILAEFASVVGAVGSAAAIQQELGRRNAELPEARRMHFRIGINLGDVIVEGDAIYGDGVNVAARLESLADPGGICVSRPVYDQVKARLGLEFDDLGEQRVKNITEPVRAYKLSSFAAGPRHPTRGATRPARSRRHKAALAAGLAIVLVAAALLGWHSYRRFATATALAAFNREAAYPLPELPSIAVLPFDNLSGDPEQEYFNNGISDSIITELYKLPDLFVIAKQSSRIYKGRPVTARQIGRELGVRYVLEGSVQRAGNRIRLNAQLIDAVTGNHVWADIYDRELKDVFAVQDEIMRKVVTEIGARISWGEAIRSMRHATDNHQAEELFVKADDLFMRFEKDSNAKARELLHQALALDPQYARALAFLSSTHYVDARFRWVKDREGALRKTEELAARAIAMDDNTYLGHQMLSNVYAEQRRFDRAVAEAQRAVEVEPGNAIANHGLGRVLLLVGRPREAVVQYKKALRLAPYPPPYIRAWAGQAMYHDGRFEEAIEQFRKLVRHNPHGAISRLAWEWLVAAHVEMGATDSARAEARRLLEGHPGYSIRKQVAIQARQYQDPSIFERHADLLRKAGLPE